MTSLKVFEDLESEVRTYCRHWPTMFSRAKGSHVYDEDGKDYVDFFAGAGGLNYGHNHPVLKEALLEYLRDDSIVLGLDVHSTAKREFLERFDEDILRPRGLAYKVQFSGPAGTTAVEAALRLARKYTGRRAVISFTNAFHGMTLGAFALSTLAPNGSAGYADDVVVMPYPPGHDGAAGLVELRQLLEDDTRPTPAAAIVETVQGDGGLRAAGFDWLRGLAELCRSHGLLLIVDDVQMGCGRTGTFFSFEPSGIYPDIVCLSKSLSGYGLPLALTLLRPDLDVWRPGEFTGTFRGTNPAFVTATSALGLWRDGELEKATRDKSDALERAVRGVAREYTGAISGVRGRGMAWGLAFHDPAAARRSCAKAFDLGLLVEAVGQEREVVKVMPPLTTSDEDLADGMSRLRDAVRLAVE